MVPNYCYWQLVALWAVAAGALNDSGSADVSNCSFPQKNEDRFSLCPDPRVCGNNGTSSANSAENVGAAFGLSIGAGISTTVGALIPLIPCVKVSNTKYLSAALALSAGVMLYVSFVQIFEESRIYFCCSLPDHYDLLATVCFFSGIVLAVLLHALVFVMQKLDCGCSCITCSSITRKTLHHDMRECTDSSDRPPAPSSPSAESWRWKRSLRLKPLIINGIRQGLSGEREEDTNLLSTTFIATCATTVIATNDHSHHRALQPTEDAGNSESGDLETSQRGDEGATLQLIDTSSIFVRTEEEEDEPVETEEDLHARGPAEFREVTDEVVHDKKHLTRMGVLTGLAIAIHNFPEGIATFVGSLSSLSLGAVLAFAIAIHNIPEGICVAMPIYYATGSKWKGIFWASLSGFAEPLGALLAYVALRGVFSPLVYGICFGLISGMMVYIALKELLPTAYKFHNSSEILIPFFLVIGMLIMAASLLLFKYA